ncbi:TnsA-like heteromeric transposase endonuclease subunit [Streptomyces sp. NBC_00984]|uniref:TnsA-like heteromeric transposase endonuclease subunit n=1 Tax=Streptomyces sp. NBC_00984 TaxID=2903700 RepID=UPI00386E5ACE
MDVRIGTGFEVVFLDPVGRVVPQRWVDTAVAVAELDPVSAFPVVSGRRWAPGLWWSATTGRRVSAGSNAMRAQLMMLDRDPGVVGLAGRPVRLLWHDGRGRGRSGVPQLFARYEGGTGMLADCPSHPKADGERALEAAAAEAEAEAEACAQVGFAYRRLEPVPMVIHGTRPIRTMCTAVLDFAIIHNDVYTLFKEHHDKRGPSIINAAYAEHNCTAGEAIQLAVDLNDQIVADFIRAKKEIRELYEVINLSEYDRQGCDRFIQGLEWLIRGVHDLHLESLRYSPRRSFSPDNPGYVDDLRLGDGFTRESMLSRAHHNGQLTATSASTAGRAAATATREQTASRTAPPSTRPCTGVGPRTTPCNAPERHERTTPKGRSGEKSPENVRSKNARSPVDPYSPPRVASGRSLGADGPGPFDTLEVASRPWGVGPHPYGTCAAGRDL